MLVEIQTLDCGGILCTEYRHEPDPEDPVIVELVCFADGEFDGSIGLQAAHPEDIEYYTGWCIGHRKFLLQPEKPRSEELDEIPF